MTEENILNHYTWSLLIYWALVFLIQWLNSVIKNLWGFFSLIFICSVGIILRLAHLVVMEWLPVAVGPCAPSFTCSGGVRLYSRSPLLIQESFPRICPQTLGSHWFGLELSIPEPVTGKRYGISVRPVGSTGSGRILFLWGTWGIYGGRKDNF